MRKQLVGSLIAALTLVGCEKQEEVVTAAPTTDGPVAASAVADCPVAGEDGAIAIYDGLDATILRNGYGRVVLRDDEVVVDAKLWVYDAAAEDGKGDFVWESGPGGFGFKIGASGFIDGWSPGVACMMVGERRELIIASGLAYGEAGRPPIPPNADIIYDLELKKVVEPEPES